MKTLGVIANGGKPSAPEVLRRLQAKAAGLGLDLLPDPATALLMGKPGAATIQEVLDRVDAIMVLGGDGTMLRTFREMAGRDLPVIGVNLGSLGFLTSVAEHDLERALECITSGEFTTSLRAVGECVLERSGQMLGDYRFLNEVVVASQSSRVVTLSLAVNGESVSHSVCDGLIVSTPTGSTGHSLSAGGPVVLPTARVFIVSLICPHTLSTRPLVLTDDAVIRVTVSNSSGPMSLTADGQVGQPLEEGDGITLRRSSRSIRFIHLPGYSYFTVLRQKLHWRGSNV